MAKNGVEMNIKKFMKKHNLQGLEMIDILQVMLNTYAGKYSNLFENLIKQETIMIDKIRIIKGYVDADETILTIGFKGTSGTAEWVNNFKVIGVKSPFAGVKGKIHLGFLERFKDVKPLLTKIFAEELEKNKIKEINFVGHSLGATTAVYAGIYAKDIFGDDIKVNSYGFGSPRPGSYRFMKGAQKKLNIIGTFKNGEDVVTKTPPLLFGYRHVGDFIRIGKWPIFKKFVLLGMTIPFFHLGILNSAEDHYPNKYANNLVKDADIFYKF